MSSMLQTRRAWGVGVVIAATAAAMFVWALMAIVNGPAPVVEAQDEWPYVVTNPDDEDFEAIWVRMVEEKPVQRAGAVLGSPSLNVIEDNCGWAALWASSRPGKLAAMAKMHIELKPGYGSITYVDARFDLRDEWGRTLRWYTCGNRTWECSQYPGNYYWTWYTYLNVPVSGDTYIFQMPYGFANTSHSPSGGPTRCWVKRPGPSDTKVIW